MAVMYGQAGPIFGAIIGVGLLIGAFLSTPVSLYMLVFSMLLGPEFVAGGLGGKTATEGRGVTLRFDDFLLAIIGFVWLVKAAIHKQEAPVKWTPLNGPMMFYVAVCLLTTFIGVLAGRVKPLTGFFFNLKYFEYFFVYFMIINAVDSEEQVRGLIKASLITCLLVSLFGIAQIPAGERASAPFEGTEGEPNTLGGYLAFLCSIVIGLLITRGAIQKRGFLITVLICGILGIFATLSRSSMLAMGIVVMLVVAFTSYRKPLLFALVLALMATSPLWAPKSVKERVLFTFEQESQKGQLRVGGLKVDTSTSERLHSWENSMKFFQKSPVWGAGITGSPYFMDAMYPRMIVETGLLGIVAFLLILFHLFRMAYLCYNRSPDPSVQGLSLGFMLGLLGLLVHGIGSNTFIIVRIMEPFWLYAAFVAKAYIALPTATAEPEAAPVSAFQPGRLMSEQGFPRAGRER
jgi:O-antigen ligase